MGGPVRYLTDVAISDSVMTLYAMYTICNVGFGRLQHDMGICPAVPIGTNRNPVRSRVVLRDKRFKLGWNLSELVAEVS